MSLQGAFEVSPGLLYFSTANQSLCPRPVLEALTRRRAEYEKNPTSGMEQVWEALWDSQTRLAQFFGARPEDCFFRSSATAVLNALILGFPLPPQSEILVGDLEYGAVVNICRLKNAREGVSLRNLRLPKTRVALAVTQTASLTQSIVSQLGENTRMLILSHVVSGTGTVLPIAEIARETRRRGILFIVDGTHAVGSVPGDFHALAHVDAYAAGLYKWMLGPKGTAFAWVSPAAQARLVPLQAGWSTFETFAPLAGFGGKNRFAETHLMHGAFDFIPFLALSDCLAFWARYPLTVQAPYRAALRSALDTSLKDSAWRRLAHGDPSLEGPMSVWEAPATLGLSPGALCRALFEKFQLQTTSVELDGRTCLILSPAVFHTAEHTAKAAQAMQSFRR